MFGLFIQNHRPKNYLLNNVHSNFIFSREENFLFKYNMHIITIFRRISCKNSYTFFLNAIFK